MARCRTIFLVLLLSVLWARLVTAEAFGNNSLAIPRVGMAFFDVPILSHEKPWGLDNQWTFSLSFLQAINYRWWWLADAGLGFGKLSALSDPYVGSFLGGVGLRYNIFEGDFRPYTSLSVNYLQFLGTATRAIPLNLGWPIFVGLKPTVGLEWLFFSEMALSLEGSYGFYVNINEPFRQVLYAQAGFAFYF